MANVGNSPATGPYYDFSLHAGNNILLSGDSVTKGTNNATGLPDATCRWSVLFESTITAAYTNAGLSVPTFTNTAVGGNTTTDWKNAVATDYAVGAQQAFIMIGVNDQFNHGNTPIPTATTQANVRTYVEAYTSQVPTGRLTFLSPIWGTVETRPRGSGPEDANIDATWLAMKAVLANFPMCRCIEVTIPIYTIYEPVQNPSNTSLGVLCQTNGGYHPTKTFSAPATMSGQDVISTIVLANTLLTLA